MDVEEAKRKVGIAAAERVLDGAVLGLGTGSTVAHFLDALGARIERERLHVKGIPTSVATETRCKELGIALTSLSEHPEIDLCVDGADEVAPGLDLIKGGGGAHFREKVIAEAARTFLVIADAGKEVPRLGTQFAVPVEVPTFAVASVLRSLAGLKPRLRSKNGVPVVTDNGHHVVDLATGPIADPRALARRIDETVGVLEHGLFLGMADEALIADAKGVRSRKE